MATLHLIHGFCGSGKTTFAKKLEKKLDAIRLNVIRFTHDEWMVAFFGINPPKDHFKKYSENIESLIFKFTEQLLRLGIDVILDYGFWSRSSRDAVRKFAVKVKVDFKLYKLECPLEVMRKRIAKRTERMPPGELLITDKTFKTLRSRFEPLEKDEKHVVVSSTKKHNKISVSKSFHDELKRIRKEKFIPLSKALNIL